MLPNSKNQHGFTMLEMLLTVAVLAIVAVVVSMSWSGYQKTQNLEGGTRNLVTMLREAQGNAVGRTDDTDWGVRIWNSVSSAQGSCGSITPSPCGSSAACAELFSGTAYAAAQVKQRTTLSDAVDLSDPPEGQCRDIFFAERSGKRVGGASMWTGYYDATNTALKAANSTSAGTCTSTSWNCSVVDNDSGGVTDTGQYASLGFDASGNPWVSYYDATNTSLKVVNYVGQGGNCDDSGAGGSDAWNCVTVDNTANVGQHTTIAFDTSGKAWVSYYDVTNTALKVANYVTSGGNCTSAAWNCTTVDNDIGGSSDTGQHTAITFDLSGNPWVSYYDLTNTNPKVARYIGSNGTCSSDAWSCESL